MKCFIITYGCQMNKSDSERIATILEKAGFQPALKIDGADLIVVNMCSVRQSAVDRVYGLVPKFKKLKDKNPKLKTVLTGCVLKRDRKKFTEKPVPHRAKGSGAGFDYVLNIKGLPKWPEILNSDSPLDADNYLKIQSKYSNNFSALVPIMTGCNNFCAYCVVPYARDREISRPAKEIICEAENLIKRGYKEIWLLGQNVNSYSDISFPQLLRKINEISGNFWIRFTSSHPKDFSDELIEAMADCDKVTEYLNLPVQAGDNEILKKMNRHYTVAQYKELVKNIRKKIPNIALSTDVIVGFPSETKKQFENTVKLFKEIKFDMAYIAKYSPRPGTTGAKLKDNVPPKEKDRREKVLTGILKEAALENNKKYIGKEVKVLIDVTKDKNVWLGKTRSHKTVKFQVLGFKFQDLLGRFMKVKITDALPWGLKGEIKKTA